jgi:PAS domain S-box-containing protein
LSWKGILAQALREIVENITKNLSEESMHANEEKFLILADAAPVMIWISGVDKLCYWFNKPWLQFVGRSMEQEHGNGWTENVHPDDFDRCLQIYTSSFDARQPFTMEYRLRRHDGEYRYIIDNGVPAIGADGRFVGYIGSCVDIHALKQSEYNLRIMDQRRNEFLATLAHELRNPLVPLRNGLESIKLAANNVEIIADVRRMMVRQVNQLVRLIDDLLEVSRINLQVIQLNTERLELVNVLQASMESSLPFIEQKSHEFTISHPPEPIHLKGDSARLSQVFTNLLINAAKFTKRGGRISLHVVRQDSNVVVTVSDSGIGIAQAMHEDIFKMFNQLGQREGHFGTGLALVKYLVEMHHGNVKVQSNGPGKGSAFIVCLPIIDTEALVSEASVDSTIGPNQK